jgi:hypothetical protein
MAKLDEAATNYLYRTSAELTSASLEVQAWAARAKTREMRTKMMTTMMICQLLRATRRKKKRPNPLRRRLPRLRRSTKFSSRGTNGGYAVQNFSVCKGSQKPSLLSTSLDWSLHFL